ncbi:hypothetical protein [Cumulibacter soli]|uniref:hypothetical protein n=1 Tax=Cumulibacter soli TaxID=2546344 RepID=UPI0010682127|nr:hypothetical protein [Cumulibacter soli]
MSDQIEPDSGDATLGSRFHLRAAALGLLALAALITAITLFGNGSGSGDESSASDAPSSSEATEASETSEEVPPTSAEESSEPPVTSEAPATSEPPASSEAPVTTDSATNAPPASGSADVSGQTSSDDPPSDALVLITSSDWNADEQAIEVVGSVQGVASESSTCTATATPDGVDENNADANKTATVDGTFDGQGTACGLMTIPMPDAKPGVYHVVIAFDDGSGQIKSDPVDVTIP